MRHAEREGGVGRCCGEGVRSISMDEINSSSPWHGTGNTSVLKNSANNAGEGKVVDCQEGKGSGQAVF
jgi:hypothetical protein